VPCASLLSPTRSRLGLPPALLLLGRLVGPLLPAAGVQLLAQVVALAFGLFASPALLGHPLVKRNLRLLASGPLGAEFLPGLLRSGPGLRLLRTSSTVSASSEASSCGASSSGTRAARAAFAWVSCAMMVSALLLDSRSSASCPRRYSACSLKTSTSAPPST
jgi:hypothetical protein